MTKNHPKPVTGTWGNAHDYLPAAGRDFLLPGYDAMVRVLGMGPVYDELIGQAELSGATSVLEIGCGTGNLTYLAARSAPSARITAIDPDPRALARARRKGDGQIRWEHAYAQQLPFPDGAFDRVLSSMMLHHLDGEVKALALGEAFRVLAPGGRLHAVDIGGTGHRGGLLSRVTGHDHGSAAIGLPDQMRSVGFDCQVLATRRLRLAGPVTFYRATKLS
ncbi:methyltransferase domain-containing protein [Mycobacterium sp. ITM-2016-00317]|uniref:class I SAM-dependent methyltransferase n=1 Tax=Mycobacterium sp. ITM-2016-00317 TaxID=2099694 RepID=UPI00287FD1EA|nr:methyltransferase domain-containing protein [Mycobacterium sp. ITM-2016-00317]WNG87192.1 methyltransferase domain-containing protein [Mycobacterium sp. ITM-2016-00317]